MRRLQDQLRHLPAGVPIRLAKRTSNLFRPRVRTGAQGLDVSGLDGVLSVERDQIELHQVPATRTDEAGDPHAPMRHDIGVRPALLTPLVGAAAHGSGGQLCLG